jgi:hypothetical protein
MVDVTILWDDGTAFLVAQSFPDNISESVEDAMREVRDSVSAGEAIYGRFVGPDGVPQEQRRYCLFYERGIRAVMADF